MHQQSLFDTTASREFLASLRGGHKGNCPCCDRYAQVYKRHLHFTVAWQLIRLYRLNGLSEYVNACELIMTGQHGTGDFQKAKYWELIERRPLTKAEDTKKSSGWWRLTPKGLDFVLGRITIPRFAMVFDDRVIAFEGKLVSVQDALDARFEYTRLMAG